MTVGSTFPGDNNETLMWVQHDLYEAHLGALGWYARERYMRAASVLGLRTDLRERILALRSFDHRVLQNAHDMIAAYYRFKHDRGGQLSLFDEGVLYEEQLRLSWSRYFHQEAQLLAEDDAVARAILRSVAYANTPEGYNAEDDLAELLSWRYEIPGVRWPAIVSERSKAGGPCPEVSDHPAARRRGLAARSPLRDIHQAWQGSPVVCHTGTPAEILKGLPTFVRRPFALSSNSGQHSVPNWRYHVIVRLPFALLGEIPVGVVSPQYTLVQHREVVQLLVEALGKLGIGPDELDAELRITELGERMMLHLYLPEKFDADPGDGHRLAMRLTCINSVDGSTRFWAVLGWLRFICANGLLVGTTALNFRRLHSASLDIRVLEGMLRHGLDWAEEERQRFAEWRKVEIDRGQLATWVDQDLQNQWGPVAAARAYRICLSGHDVRVLDASSKVPPTGKRVENLASVPGIIAPVHDAYSVSQVLSWLATSRREIPEQLERQEHIRQLMDALLTRVTRNRKS